MDHHFQVNLKGLIDLLSNHLYSGPEVFLRELLQNAVDAIRAREKLQKEFKGEITLELIRKGSQNFPTLLISENGIGLTESEIHLLLATIGESSKRAVNGEGPTDFLGQFGIGLLSCFMVTDEIVVVTRSAREETPAMEWRGRSDGTYTVKTLKGIHEPGTQVFLTCKEGAEEWFEAQRLKELTLHYGSLLPYAIHFNSGNTSKILNREVPAWRRNLTNPTLRRKALLDLGKEIFDQNFFDAIPLKIKAGGIDGVAFILDHSPQITIKPVHRIFLKNMYLTEKADNLLPPWAYFIKVVINTNSLKPTASREGFQEDKSLLRAREEIGDCLKAYLVDLSQNDPDKLARLISLHELTLKALAVDDDDFYRIIFDWIPIETSHGPMTLGEYRRQFPVIRYAPTVDQFRQISQVASAQEICLINGGYVYVRELLEKLPHHFEEARVETIDASDIADTFSEIPDSVTDKRNQFEKLANQVLRPFLCHGNLRRFAPADLPCLYTISPEGLFQRNLQQSRDISKPLWSSVLGNLAPKGPLGSTFSQLCFNYDNYLIKKLLDINNLEIFGRTVQLLYVQALLLGHHPLQSRELKLLNEGLLGMIDLGLGSKSANS